MLNRSQKLSALILSILALSVLPACPIFSGGNTNDNTNTNNNDNANSNDNTNTNDNTNGNDNDDESDFSLFTDPEGDFSTTQVRDVDGETIRFRISNQAIVYQDGTEYDEGLWPVTGNFLGGNSFQVRFGTEDGQRAAYFTETGPATICNYVVSPTDFIILPTQVTVPQE